MTKTQSAAAEAPLSTFRIHHDDAQVTTVRATSPHLAAKDFLIRNPAAVIRKIKIDRQELRREK